MAHQSFDQCQPFLILLSRPCRKKRDMSHESSSISDAKPDVPEWSTQSIKVGSTRNVQLSSEVESKKVSRASSLVFYPSSCTLQQSSSYTSTSNTSRTSVRFKIILIKFIAVQVSIIIFIKTSNTTNHNTKAVQPQRIYYIATNLPFGKRTFYYAYSNVIIKVTITIRIGRSTSSVLSSVSAFTRNIFIRIKRVYLSSLRAVRNLKSSPRYNAINCFYQSPQPW